MNSFAPTTGALRSVSPPADTVVRSKHCSTSRTISTTPSCSLSRQTRAGDALRGRPGLQVAVGDCHSANRLPAQTSWWSHSGAVDTGSIAASVCTRDLRKMMLVCILCMASRPVEGTHPCPVSTATPLGRCTRLRSRKGAARLSRPLVGLSCHESAIALLRSHGKDRAREIPLEAKDRKHDVVVLLYSQQPRLK